MKVHLTCTHANVVSLLGRATLSAADGYTLPTDTIALTSRSSELWLPAETGTNIHRHIPTLITCLHVVPIKECITQLKHTKHSKQNARHIHTYTLREPLSQSKLPPHSNGKHQPESLAHNRFRSAEKLLTTVIICSAKYAHVGGRPRWEVAWSIQGELLTCASESSNGVVGKHVKALHSQRCVRTLGPKECMRVGIEPACARADLVDLFSY